MPRSVILLLALLLLAIAPGAYAAPLFVGRTQNTVNVPNTSMTLTVPAGIADGDVMLVFIASYNSVATAPTGWSAIGSRSNANADVGTAFWMTWHTGDPTSYTFGNVNWPKAIMRVYSGVTGIDAAAFALSNGSTAGLDLPALPATTAAGDEYVAFFATDNATSIIGPSDLGDPTGDTAQWGTFDGDKIIAGQGTAPASENANLSSGTGNWIGLAVTLDNVPAVPPAVLPYGDIAPPAGQSWHLTLDDEFANDTPGGPTNGINTTLWNAGPGGGWPGCAMTNDVIGNSGGCRAFYGNPYDGTTAPAAPYIGIEPGVGLVIQNLNNASEAGGGNDFPDQDWMGLQSWGKFTQRFGYFEISARMPTDAHGEGDGLHPDLWLVPVGRTQWCYCAHSDEVDIAENDLGAATTGTVHFNVWDTTGAGIYYDDASTAYPGNAGDLSSAFHRYAVYWRDDGAHGTFQAYFDGQPVGSPVTVQDSLWDGGVYLFPGWMEQVGLGAFYGGANVDSTTSNTDPLVIQYVRVWQGQ